MKRLNKEEKLKLEKRIIKELKALGKMSDIEGAHIDADNLLCDFLKKLGYDKVAEAFDDLSKWYA
jgi:hypothetical protein